MYIDLALDKANKASNVIPIVAVKPITLVVKSNTDIIIGTESNMHPINIIILNVLHLSMALPFNVNQYSNFMCSRRGD